MNLLQANTADLRLHLAMVVDLLVRVLGLPPRARTIIHQGCHEVYRRFGLWDGHHDVWPTLYDLYEWVRTAPDLNAASREAILDRLATLLLSLTPRCAAYRKAWLAADLARYSIVFEMSGTSELVKQIVVEPLLYSLFLHEVQRGVINQPTRLFVFFEDGQRFFSTTHELASGEIAPMDELAGIIRGSAIGVGVNVQSTIGLSRRLVPNLATKFCGRLGSHEDYSSVGADLGLNSQQIDWWRLHSRPGMFLGQVAEGPWREPFLFQVPLLDVPAVVNDAEVAASVAELDALPVVPAQEFTHWEPRPVVEMKSETTTLSEVEIRFLQGVIKQPGQSSTYYATQAGLNGQTAAKVRTRLVDLGHIREHSVATGRRGRMALILEPLPSASAAIGTTAPEGV
ncbi:MAG: hypothetical protein PCFJNLEI_01616 [Verrucomicrobiae bacterium]|nr:hypothetical protein [Verrucomicrobiae bacterium]